MSTALHLVFSIAARLTILVGVFVCACAWLNVGVSAAQAQDGASESRAEAALQQPAHAPTAPLQDADTQMTDSQSAEDSPDDEEFADLAKWLVGRAPAFVQQGPTSIQLEPSHAPSTQLDRPPRI